MYRTKDVTYSLLKDLALLVKFKLSVMVVLTAVLGYLIAMSLRPDWEVLILLVLGGFSLTAGSNILNEILERDYDKLMKRTMIRPIAAGRMHVANGVILAGVSSILGLILLSLIHPLCGILGSISLVAYAFIYTPLKRLSPLAVPVGALPGAVPVLIGWVAATGSISETAIYLFLLQYLWQFPHFWAIGYLGFEDYQKAGFRLLPTKDGKLHPQVSWHSVVYCTAILCMAIWIAYSGVIVSPIVGIILILVSILFLLFSLNFWRKQSRRTALHLMLASLMFMPMSLLVFLLDVM